MGAKKNPKNLARFRNLIDEFRQSGKSIGRSIKMATEIIGISERTGWRWYRGDVGDGDGSNKGALDRQKLRRQSVRIPDPLDYKDLSDIAKRMIAPDGYPLFLEKIFGWTLVPWERKAAEISVKAILDDSERHYGISNQPPGSGKSSNWTFALPVWLNVGGGFEDPARGRRLRFQLGHASKEMAKMYVQRVGRLYESPRVFYDTKTGEYGELVLAKEFGRLRPLQSMGDISLWQDKQLIVAQLEDIDLADKEPTFMAVSPGAEFIGGRCEYACWDDLVTEKTTANVDQVEKMATWFEKESEQRIEPGGILWIVGQRIGSFDLFRNRLDMTWVDESNEIRHKYFHIVFPVHYEPSCDATRGGSHRQWNAEEGADADGCLLDAKRLPWKDILKDAGRPHYRTVFQQEDIDPVRTLVTKVMLEGGSAHEINQATNELELVTYPGCYDKTRKFGDFPKGFRPGELINYVTVDPAAGGRRPTSDWAIQWWATTGEEGIRYLIYGWRRTMPAGDFLDWDPDRGEHVGLMEKIQQASVAANQPIRAWVIEAVGAFHTLFQYRHFDDWRRKWPFVEVIPHETQKNKWDPSNGVEILLRSKYRSGRASIPYMHGDVEAFNFVKEFTKQLTTWTRTGGTRDDEVMADWFGEVQIEEILRAGRRPMREFSIDDSKMPPYLLRQRREIDPNA